jgi:hypothetical protein
MREQPELDAREAQAAADRATYRQGVLIGVLLGFASLALAGLYATGVFDPPPPPFDAYPCGERNVDLGSDEANCGGCGITCSAGYPVCRDGSCECADGWVDCDECRDTRSDPHACGACDTSCAPGVACVEGACRCDDSRTLCATYDEGDGTTVWDCVDTRTSALHCGECDHGCGGGWCLEGVCQ